jgi:IS5 family transposase
MMALGMPGFFDIDERLAALSAKGDDLERIKGLVDFEIFRFYLEAAVPCADRARGGRPAFDHVLMFKILILQTMHSLSDERCEYLIKDRLSFMRFLGLGLSDAVPDANTIWTFRAALKKADAIDVLFRQFDEALRASGFLAMSVRSSTPRLSRRPSSATRLRRKRRSRTVAFPSPGRTSQPNARRRIAMRAGR